MKFLQKSLAFFEGNEYDMECGQIIRKGSVWRKTGWSWLDFIDIQGWVRDET